MFYWVNNMNDIYKIIDILSFWGIKIGRIGGQIVVKNNHIIWQHKSLHMPHSLYDLVYPGYMGYRWNVNNKPLLYIIDQMSIRFVYLFGNLIYKYKFFFYAFAYKMVLKRFPNSYNLLHVNHIYNHLLFKKERDLINKSL